MTFRVLFWNVWCLPSFATDGTYSDDRAQSIVPMMKGYDLVIFNESWTDAAKDVFKKEYKYNYKTDKKCCKFLDSGLFILSNYPILNASHILYSESSNWDWFASKGAIHFQILTTNGVYDFFTTHLQADHQDADHKARMFQCLELVNFVNKNMPTGNNIFLIGDFNMMLYDGNQSGLTYSINDAILRSGNYKMILDQTKLPDLNTGHLLDVYHILSRKPSKDVKIAYHDSKGLTDGPYITIDISLT